MKQKKNNNGITLVALVVTIIVLLILAAVSINLVLGENGIITRAKVAKSETQIKQFSETLKLEENVYLMDKSENEDVARKELYNKIKQYGYSVFNEKNEELLEESKIYNALDFVVKKDEMSYTIQLENMGNRLLVSNETELRDALQYTKDNELSDVQIQAVKNFSIENAIAMENVNFFVRKDITITANAKLNITGTSIIGGQENSTIKSGENYGGTVIEFTTGPELNLMNINIDGNGVWSGETDRILNRGIEYTKACGYNNNAIISLGYANNASIFRMDNVTVKNVATSQTGGNIYCGRPGTVEIKNCNFYNNAGSDSVSNAGSAGLFWFTSYPNITFDNCRFKGNASYGDQYYNGGGSIRIQNGFANIKNCTFENNGTFGGNYGGAIYFYNGTFKMENCEFRKNYSSCGGALRTFEQEAFVSNCRFYENETSGVGAVLSCPKKKVQFDSCKFENNKGNASDGFGGILWGTDLNLNNCSIKSNTNTNSDSSSLASAMVSASIKLSISGETVIDGNNTNIYIGQGLKNVKFEVTGTLTKSQGIKISVDSNITAETVIAVGKDYTLTNQDLSAFKCETSGYALKLKTDTNEIVVYKL